jgi:signal recognition particle receptor subunit beta
VVTCTECGAENPAGAVFCTSCDALLGWQDSPPAAPAPTRTVPAVVVQEPEPKKAPETDANLSEALRRAQGAFTPEPEPVPEPVPVSEPAVVPEVRDLAGALAMGRQLAEQDGRTDLDRHLRRADAELATRAIPVVVVGEFKRGKSTLVNALLQSAVCPVDADLVTAVPTTVRWAPTPTVSALVRGDDGEVVTRHDVPLEQLAALITELADPADPERQRAVEVGLPHRMLRSGLQLVDTPGVGGLDSAHGFLALGALRAAAGVVFVTDAAQELTGPELTFLRSALERCPRAVLVVTKTDLYPRWRDIVELDRGHLVRAGIDIPVVPLSSFLRLRAQHDPALNEESGFAGLVTFLARDVVAKVRGEAAQVTAQEVGFVAAQLEQQTEAERAVLEQPERSQEVVTRLEEAVRATARLADPTATWQQTLSDGVQDLFSEVEHDLQSRLRAVLAEVDGVVEAGDPQDTWADTEVWLRRQVAMVTEANRDLLVERAVTLADTVAEQFDLQAGSALRLPDGQSGVDFSAVALAPRSSLVVPGGKLAPFMTAARTSFYLPMLMGSVAASMLTGGLPVHLIIVGFSLALGAGIGRKIISDERKRQRTYRQQQAKTAVRRFVDEVAFLAGKQTRDGLRQAQRELRDDFQRRATMLHSSANAAREAAERARRLSEADQRVRVRELEERQRQVDQVRAAVRGAGVPAEVGARG